MANPAQEEMMAAYFISDQQEVTDPETLKTYGAGVMDTLKKYGGKVIARDSEPEGVEGDWDPKRVIIVEFADKAGLKAWYGSPEYSKILNLRLASAKGNAMMVDGA
ncbi:MAG: DUF1330 domain-containing protein [Rhodospirillaceae bacterium]|nr:DUF1330 domain-containing protein [Rhodospirillaceae bacterium]MBT5457676.1 DUF1330 domain-containing protein [Rhodospirillaceae bacterium]